MRRGPLEPRLPPLARAASPPATLALATLALAGAGCARPDAAQAARSYAEALAAVAEDPAAGAGRCLALSWPALREDCAAAAAERLARADAEEAAALCDALDPGPGRDECHFVVAEGSKDARRCDRAGTFADDCRLHRLSADLAALVPAPQGPGDFEAALAQVLPAYGLLPDDPRPWSAAYRHVLDRSLPLDRGRCGAVTEPARAEACRHTAVALLHDRLNAARSSRTFPCDGGPLPPLLEYVPDPELDAAVAARRERDLCR
ncbi:hypothetical protein L6R53_18430 [Myxococcota bacterium]|nr:hypothetical protein [Myxococcota bacterium]